MNREAVKQLIIDHEGKKYKVYLDSEGIKTIGVGYNLEDATARAPIEFLGLDFDDVCAGTCTLEEQHVQNLFDIKLNDAIADAAVLIDGFEYLPDGVQHAIIDMSFNMGGPRLAQFKAMIAALEQHPPDLREAAAEMLDSKWARQVPARAQDDVNLVLNSAGG